MSVKMTKNSNHKKLMKKVKSTLALVAFMAVLAISVFGTSFGTVDYIAKHDVGPNSILASESVGSITAPVSIVDSLFFGGR